MSQSYELTFNKSICYFFIILTCCFITFSFASAESEIIEKDAKENASQKKVIQDNSSNQQGLTVYIDPDTGELISPPEETESLVEPNNAVINNAPDNELDDQIVIIENPDGSTTFIYPDSHQFTNKIKIDENGKVVSECKREHE